MSRLIALGSDNQLVAELEGFEYGYYAFDNVDPIETQVEINEMANQALHSSYQRTLQRTLEHIDKCNCWVHLHMWHYSHMGLGSSYQDLHSSCQGIQLYSHSGKCHLHHDIDLCSGRDLVCSNLQMDEQIKFTL